MGKKTEAKLFYQEMVDRFPKNPLTAKARQEMKRLKSANR
jgi:TolA-binding protein